MNFAFFIAKRYLVSKKTTNVINLISLITVIGVAVGTMSLIVILSVFNGLESFVKSRFNSFDPDIKIIASSGKSFSSFDENIEKLKNGKDILYYTEVIEENALIKYKEVYHPFVIKGVESDFKKMASIEEMMLEGDFLLYFDSIPVSVIGSGVAGFLSVQLDFSDPLTIYMPKSSAKAQNINADPTQAFRIMSIYPVGVFSIDQEVDDYIIVPIQFAKKLLNYKDKITAIEISLKEEVSVDKFKKKIKKLLGKNYLVKDRYEQKEFIYKIMKSEKLIIFLILTFILIIASFNIIGSLTMLILDKKEDISTLRSMGANLKVIKRIFWFEGWMISICGALIGLGLGAMLCFLQTEFEFVKLQGEADRLFITAYPVEMQIWDFIYVLFTVIFIGFFASWYPVRYITRKYLILQ
ncbi:MAG: FtsX-like permease family protein [Bacteroidota bacterium]